MEWQSKEWRYAQAPRRWMMGFAVALAAHVALIVAVMERTSFADGFAMSLPPVVAVAFMPAATAPPLSQQGAAQTAQVVETVELPKAQAVLPKLMPRQKQKRPRQTAAAVSAAPSAEITEETVHQQAVVAAAEVPQSTVADVGLPQAADARPDYYALLSAWLDKYKEYPRRATQRGQTGRVLLWFELDRSGRVLSHRIEHSSGYVMLDRAVEDALQRAQPFPPMPDSIREPRLTVTVPVTFSLHT